MTNEREDTDEETFVTDGVPSHSLPTPEELKTQAAIAAIDQDNGQTRSNRGGGRNRNFAAFVVGLCVVALVISLSIFFAKKTVGFTPPPVDRLSLSHDFVSSMPIVGKEEALADENSTQSLAIKWLANEDPLQLDIPMSADTEDAKTFMNRYIMAVLYFSTNGEKWNDQFNFLTEKTTCEWGHVYQNQFGVKFELGVACDENDSIVGIWLPLNNMNGIFPFEEISMLSSLTLLSFEFNEYLTGSIPESISNLSELKFFVFSNNELTDTLPASMEDMASLQTIMLDDNLLSGEITPILNLPNLQVLYLEDNFFGGSLDNTYFLNTRTLVHLDLSDNAFTGQVPVRFLQMPNLEVLDLHGNVFLHGEIPDIAAEQTTLQVLALHENSLTGEIPASINNLKGLRHLDLSGNGITGTVPETMGDLIDLEYLFIGINEFDEMPFPSFVRDLTNLTELSLKKTSLTGQIPEWIGNDLSLLRLLDLDGNKLTGPIPNSMTNLTNLIFLLLNRNELTGTVPPDLKYLNLEVLLLDHNSLSGDLDVICYLFDFNPADMIIADCGGENPEITCSLGDCCHTCCSDDDVFGCNDKEWRGNRDPVWEHFYERRYHSFDDEIAWIPAGRR